MGIVCAAALLLNAYAALAVSWTDWDASSIVSGSSGYGSGVISLGTGNVGVTLTGLVGNFENGDYYYNNGATGGTSPSGTYGGLTPSDLIREWGSGWVTLTFSQPVVDPYIALISVGQPGFFVNYAFQNLQNGIDVASYGSNYWGYGGYAVNGDTFSGREYNGILELEGTYNSITFEISPNENWHGFNVGVESAAAPVPEPSTMILLGCGLLALVVTKMKKAQ